MSFTEEDEKPVWVENQGIPSGGMEESLSEGETMTPEGEAVGGQFVAVDPGMVEVPAGREFRLNIEIQSDEEIGNLALDLNFDPKVLRLKDVVEGQFMRSSGSGAPFMKNIDNGAGACTLGFSAPPSGKGARGAGILATLIFEGVDQGETDISLNRVTAGDKNSRPLRFDSQGAHAVVH